MVPLKFKKVQHLLVTVFRMNTIVKQIKPFDSNKKVKNNSNFFMV